MEVKLRNIIKTVHVAYEIRLVQLMEILKKIFCFPFTKTHSQNRNNIKENKKGEVVNKINFTNSNDILIILTI